MTMLRLIVWAGLVALTVIGLGLVLVACGSSTDRPMAETTRLSSSCIPPAFRSFWYDAHVPEALPKKIATPLDAAILSSFGIFHRPALPADKPSRLTPEGGGLDRELPKLYELAGYYPAYVRELATPPNGRRYFVIPAYGRSEAVVPAHCLAGGERERRLLVEEQHRRLVEPLDCIVQTGDDGGEPSQGCEPFAAIDEGGRVFQANALAKEPTVELVPDGITSVRIAFRETPTITRPVRENTFMFTPPPPTSRIAAELKRLEPAIAARSRRLILQWDRTVEETDPVRLEWLNGAGRVIRVISRPATGTSVGNLLAPETAVGGLRAPIGG